ncbi:hypothetical protein GCM10020367_55140 [Streptomyces sannanensis]|uniref:Uncharacterized protein n=1 Tax=Streptomyces sannanensis TaxID=285536 RepID=A0ABP6SIN3_9ACTN
MSTAAWHEPSAGAPPRPRDLRDLRAAVEELLPDSVEAYAESLDDATTRALQSGSLAPLQSHRNRWTFVIANRSDAERAARFAELGRKVQGQGEEEDLTAAYGDLIEVTREIRRESRG